jgi:hypothetical protein
LRYLAQYNPPRFNAIVQSDTNARQLAIQLGLIKADFFEQIGDFFAQIGNFIIDTTAKAWNYLKENPDVRNTLMDIAGAGIGYGIAKHHYSKSLNEETLTPHSLEDRDMSRMKPSTGIPMGAMGGILTSKLIRQGLGMIDPNLKENSGMYAANSIDRLITPNVDNASALGIFGTAGAMVGKGLYEGLKKPETMLDENMDGNFANEMIEISNQLKSEGILDSNLNFFDLEKGTKDFELIREIRENYVLLTKDIAQGKKGDQIWETLKNSNRPIRIIGLKAPDKKELGEIQLQKLYNNNNIYPVNAKEALKDLFYFICKYSKILHKTYSHNILRPTKFFIEVKAVWSTQDEKYIIKMIQKTPEKITDSSNEILMNLPFNSNKIFLNDINRR